MERKHYHKYTDEEKREIRKLIEENRNVATACRIFAQKYNLKFKTVYGYIIGGTNPVDYKDIKLTTNKWTDKEKKDCLKLISEHPGNFREAFRIHARNTGKSVKTVEIWFDRYRRRKEAKVCMCTIGGKKAVSPNRKNIYNNKKSTYYKPMKKSLWDRIISIISSIFNK